MLRLILVFFRTFSAIKDLNERVKEESKEWDDKHPEAKNTPKANKYMHQVIGVKVLLGSMLLGELDLSFLFDSFNTDDWFFMLGVSFAAITSLGLFSIVVFQEGEKKDNIDEIITKENKEFHKEYKARINRRRAYRKKSKFLPSL